MSRFSLCNHFLLEYLIILRYNLKIFIDIKSNYIKKQYSMILNIFLTNVDQCKRRI